MLPAMADLARRILHAESYPFTRPACSYLFREGGMHPLPAGSIENRTPVIASGSNASPHRLAAKFGDREDMPVTRATLRDFAVVFAGHFTAYGAIPATLCRHEGAVTEVWITWLTAAQLDVMHRSEGVIGCREAAQRYDHVELADIDLRPERRPPINRASAYLSRRMLAPDSEPVRFAEVVSRTNRLRAHSHCATLRKTASLLSPATPFHAFMDYVLSGVTERQALFERLTPFTLPRTIGPSV
ncbi:MAG: hypothetical protein AAF543_09875 [Pseudomonadota bacterium]